MDRAIVLHRVPERHPGVSREDAAEAWARCIAAMQRVAKERGISRTEFVRQAIDHELLSAAP